MATTGADFVSSPIAAIALLTRRVDVTANNVVHLSNRCDGHEAVHFPYIRKVDTLEATVAKMATAFSDLYAKLEQVSWNELSNRVMKAEAQMLTISDLTNTFMANTASDHRRIKADIQLAGHPGLVCMAMSLTKSTRIYTFSRGRRTLRQVLCISWRVK